MRTFGLILFLFCNLSFASTQGRHVVFFSGFYFASLEGISIDSTESKLPSCPEAYCPKTEGQRLPLYLNFYLNKLHPGENSYAFINGKSLPWEKGAKKLILAEAKLALERNRRLTFVGWMHGDVLSGDHYIEFRKDAPPRPGEYEGDGQVIKTTDLLNAIADVTKDQPVDLVIGSCALGLPEAGSILSKSRLARGSSLFRIGKSSDTDVSTIFDLSRIFMQKLIAPGFNISLTEIYRDMRAGPQNDHLHLSQKR